MVLIDKIMFARAVKTGKIPSYKEVGIAATGSDVVGTIYAAVRRIKEGKFCRRYRCRLSEWCGVPISVLLEEEGACSYAQWINEHLQQ